MRLKEVVETLKLQRLTGNDSELEQEVSGCYIGDLLSNVMAHAKAGDLWLTVQTHQNIVAVATLLNIPAIVLPEGHLPQGETLAKANQEGIVLLSSEDSAYKLAGLLHLQGLGR